jgi:hypothetical protein
VGCCCKDGLGQARRVRYGHNVGPDARAGVQDGGAFSNWL